MLEPLTDDERSFVQEMVIETTPDAFVLNKPPGLATQGGTKTDQHLDRLLDGLADECPRPGAGDHDVASQPVGEQQLCSG